MTVLDERQETLSAKGRWDVTGCKALLLECTPKPALLRRPRLPPDRSMEPPKHSTVEFSHV